MSKSIVPKVGQLWVTTPTTLPRAKRSEAPKLFKVVKVWDNVTPSGKTLCAIMESPEDPEDSRVVSQAVLDDHWEFQDGPK